MANDKGVSPVVAGAVGAAVGAVVGAAAVELTKPEVQEKLADLKEKGEKVYTDLKQTATDVKDKVEAAKQA